FFNADISSDSIVHVYLFTTGSTPSQGQLVDAARSTVSPTNPRELDAPLLMPGRLPQGSYAVRWTALATDDGHATSGLIGFNVEQLRTQGRPLQWLCLVALLGGEIINLSCRATRRTQALNNRGIDLAAMRQLVLETSYGHLWLVRLGLIGIALGYLWRTTREQH